MKPWYPRETLTRIQCDTHFLAIRSLYCFELDKIAQRQAHTHKHVSSQKLIKLLSSCSMSFFLIYSLKWHIIGILYYIYIIKWNSLMFLRFNCVFYIVVLIFWFQSRASLVSSSDGGILAEGETSSSEASGDSTSPPCDLGLYERLLLTHPVWFLPGIQRAGAVHLLQGKEEGVSFGCWHTNQNRFY